MKKPLLLLLLIQTLFFGCKDANSVNPNNSGKGGSTARFTIAKNHLYIVDNQSLKVFTIADQKNPTFIARVPLSTVVETIFPFNNHLLIGTQTGMYIFNIDLPASPKQISVYNHVVSCDPVVAEGNYAFVTLRSGTTCNRGSNVLEVIDIKDLTSPKLINSYPMQSPHGLGIDGDLLFVTEGSNGMKIFDKSNPKELKEITKFTDFNAMDVIPENNNLIVTGRDGIYQYSYNDKKELVLQSKIEIKK